MKKFIIISIIFCVLFIGHSQISIAAPKRLLNNIKSNDAIFVVNNDGKVVLGKHSGQLCIPASILKIVTSLAAFHYLGTDYRFKTEFYRSPDGFLKIKGYGDPVLVSEELEKISHTLQKEYQEFSGIGLDATYFKESIKIPGITHTLNPYDAKNAALCVNFNTVCFRRESSGLLVTGEPHTPLLNFARKKIKKYMRSGRINLFRKHSDILLYTGHLMHFFLLKQGIEIKEKIIKIESVNDKDKLLMTHFSGATVEEIVSMLLRFSNNFIANQLLLSIGAKIYGPPATLKKGIEAIKNFAQKSLNIHDFKIVEGSGISRKNKISAKEMIKAVKAFEPYRNLLTHEENLFYKTGTLNGVRTRAGFIETEYGKTFPFVVMLNRKNVNNYRMDVVINSLNKYLAKKHAK